MARGVENGAAAHLGAGVVGALEVRPVFREFLRAVEVGEPHRTDLAVEDLVAEIDDLLRDAADIADTRLDAGLLHRGQRCVDAVHGHRQRLFDHEGQLCRGAFLHQRHMEMAGGADHREIECFERGGVDVGIAFGDAEERRRFGAAARIGLDDRQLGRGRSAYIP